MPSSRAIAPPLARWATLILVLATLLTYGWLTRCEFTSWDDPSTLALNPDLNPPTAGKITRYWTQPHMGLYAPVTYTVWGALASVAQGELPNALGSRLKPSIFHIANVLLHLLTVLVVYRILVLLLCARTRSDGDAQSPERVVAGASPRKLLCKDSSSGCHIPRLRGHAPGTEDMPTQAWDMAPVAQNLAWTPTRREVRPTAAWPALAGALLFALHPTQVEPVAWASGLKDVLCGLFVVTAIWQYLRSAMAVPRAAVCATGGTKGSRFAALLATLCFLAAMLSKPTAVTAPLIALALDAFILRRPLRRILPLLACWLLLSVPVLIITARVQKVGVVAPVALWFCPFIAGDALAFYLHRIAVPAGFIFDYGRRPAVVLAQSQTYFIWLIPMLLAGWIWRHRRRHPWLIAASLTFLAPLLPVLGLRPFMMQYTSTVTDHYLYQPMIGVAIAFAFVLSLARTRAVTFACTLLLGSLALRSFVQTQYWRNDETLCRHCLAINPDSFPTHLNLGHDLEVRGQFEQELHEFTEAVRANPDFPLSRGNCAVMQATLGHIDEAEHECRELIRLTHSLPLRGQQAFVPTYAFVGRQLLHRGQPARAIALLDEALRLDPHHQDASSDRAKAQSAIAAIDE